MGFRISRINPPHLGPTYRSFSAPANSRPSRCRLATPNLTEFEVQILTIRSGTCTVRIVANDAAAVRSLVQSECETGEHRCPPEWCTDDVESTVLDVRQVARDHSPGSCLDAEIAPAPTRHAAAL